MVPASPATSSAGESPLAAGPAQGPVAEEQAEEQAEVKAEEDAEAGVGAESEADAAPVPNAAPAPPPAEAAILAPSKVVYSFYEPGDPGEVFADVGTVRVGTGVDRGEDGGTDAKAQVKAQVKAQAQAPVPVPEPGGTATEFLRGLEETPKVRNVGMGAAVPPLMGDGGGIGRPALPGPPAAPLERLEAWGT